MSLIFSKSWGVDKSKSKSQFEHDFFKIILKVKNTDGGRQTRSSLALTAPSLARTAPSLARAAPSLARSAPSLARAVLQPLSSDLAADLLPPAGRNPQGFWL